MLETICFPAWIRTMIFPVKTRDMLPLQHRKTEVSTRFELVNNPFAEDSLEPLGQLTNGGNKRT